MMAALTVVASVELPHPPYGKVKANGLYFKLDIERMKTSATWALCPGELHNDLIRVWVEAWQNTPCGTLEDDSNVIAARIELDPAVFVGHRSTLLRGFYRCSDGLLYHPTITEQVLEFIHWRERKSTNQAAYRLRHRSVTGNGRSVTGSRRSVSATEPEPVPVKAKARGSESKDSSPLVGLTPDESPGLVNSRQKDRELKATAVALLSFLNERAGRRYEPVEPNIRPLVARIREVGEVKVRQVIANRCLEWSNSPRMAPYLRPDTLFNATKFHQYVGLLGAVLPKDGEAP